MGDGETEMGRGGEGEGDSWGEGQRGGHGSLARRRNCSLLGRGSNRFWGIWGGESTFCKAVEWRSEKPVVCHTRETHYSANHTPSTIDHAPLQQLGMPQNSARISSKGRTTYPHRIMTQRIRHLPQYHPKPTSSAQSHFKVTARTVLQRGIEQYTQDIVY